MALFSPQTAAIAKGAQDQNFGFNMLIKALTGRDTYGGGPFDDFMQQYLGPITTAAINALGTINNGGASVQPGQTGHLPVNIDNLFANIGTGLGGGQVGGKDLYTYLSSLGRDALAAALGGPQGQSLSEIQNALGTFAPLETIGMTGGNRSAFYRQQDDVIRALQNQAATDKTMMAGAIGPQGNDGPTWGQFISTTPFYGNYYNQPLPKTSMQPSVAPGSAPGDPRSRSNVSM